MTVAYKVLGQLAPSATTLTTLYTAPNPAVTSGLVVTNLGASTTFRVAVRPAAAAIDPKHYIAYDQPINQGDSIPLPQGIGITLAATDVISVYAGHANLSFSLFGQEIS